MNVDFDPKQKIELVRIGDVLTQSDCVLLARAKYQNSEDLFYKDNEMASFFPTMSLPEVKTIFNH